jgi:hypothetical protein
MAGLVWTIFGLLALLWTAGAWVTAEAAEWIAQALASGTAGQAARGIAALPVPQWVRLWLDPAWLEALQSALRWVIDSAERVLPLAGPAAAWLVPVVWIGWGLGMVLLLAAAIAVHALARRTRRPGTAP